MLSYGKNVLLMTNPKEIKKVYINKSKQDQEVYDYLKKNKIHYVLTEKEVLNKMTKENHQGIIIDRDEFAYKNIEELYNKQFVVILDHLEDPHNFGAIIRTCEAAGVDGIIIPKDRSVSVNDTVYKTSVGTTDKVPIIKVTNLVDAIKKLQDHDYFIYGSDMQGTDCRQISFSTKKVLIIGNEGKGISPLIAKNCDEIIKIPMVGKVNSLNASVAAAILIYKMGDLIWVIMTTNFYC